MSSVKYEFRYMPLIGKLSGESMLQQTEQAINEIAEIVNENTAQADIINTLAQDANDNSVEALEKANEALETSSRVYIHESLAVNLDNYCESQLIYVGNISSTNLPITKKGFLEVKTDDDKTECVQLFVSDDKDVYVRSGSITAETVGDITTYTADFEEWTSLSSPTILLQAGSGTFIPLSADLNDYNTEGTFYCSTTNVGSISHCPVSEGEFKLIVMKFATANYGLQMLYPIGKHLYVRKYSGGTWGNWEVIVPKITSGVTNGSIAVNDTDVPVTGWNTKADLDSPVFVGTPTAPTPTDGDNSTKIATTAFVRNGFLQLSGGTMSGAVTTSAVDFIKRTTNDNHLAIMGGTAYGNSASILLNGGSASSNGGAFQLLAQNGSTNKTLLGKPDGQLTWDGLPIPVVGKNAGGHNSIYRGKNLGTSVTAAQWASIKAGTFDDMFIGDYWVINGITWRIAAFDYWLNCGDTNTTAHHVVVVPDSNLASCKMNDTNITTGAYIGSDYYTGNNSNTGKATAQTAINNAFGAAHILSHRELLANGVNSSGQASGWAWYDSTFELMNEAMVYGHGAWGSHQGYETGIDKGQLPLFALEPSRITNRAYWWLRSVVSAAHFAFVDYNGCANYYGASHSFGVRPAFAIYQS